MGQRGNQVWAAAAEVGAHVSLRYGQATHSSVPSAKNWCFQIGTCALTVSTRSVHAAKAAPR